MTSRSNEDMKLMRIKEVCDLLKVSRATIYRWVEEGKFPEPVVLGHDDGKRSAVRWFEVDVLYWLAKKPKGIQKNGT